MAGSRSLVCDSRVEVAVENDNLTATERGTDNRRYVLPAVVKEGCQFFVRVQSSVLRRLPDAAAVRAVRWLFRSDDGFANSLKRFAEARNLGRFARTIDALNGNKNSRGPSVALHPVDDNSNGRKAASMMSIADV